jgi:hypothetical protein
MGNEQSQGQGQQSQQSQDLWTLDEHVSDEDNLHSFKIFCAEVQERVQIELAQIDDLLHSPLFTTPGTRFTNC